MENIPSRGNNLHSRERERAIRALAQLVGAPYDKVTAPIRPRGITCYYGTAVT